MTHHFADDIDVLCIFSTLMAILTYIVGPVIWQSWLAVALICAAVILVRRMGERVDNI